MSSNSWVEIPDLLFRFLSELPQTVQPSIAIFVALYATGNITENPKDCTKQMAQFLSDLPGISLFSSVLRTIAAIDYVLAARVASARKNEENMQKIAATKPEPFASLAEAIVPHMPLQRKHLERALTEWDDLKATRLSPEQLQDFEDMCLCPSQTAPTAKGQP